MFRRDIELTIINGAYVNGAWVPSVSNTITFKGSVQSVQGRELETLAEGRRVKEAYTIYTQDNVDLDASPDQVELFGKKFEMVSFKPWTNGIINHTEMIFMRFYDAN